jgi:hypothetical protein
MDNTKDHIAKMHKFIDKKLGKGKANELIQGFFIKLITFFPKNTIKNHIDTI